MSDIITESSTEADPAPPKKDWRYKLGLLMFIVPFPIFFATPVVIPLMGFSATESVAVIGAVLVVVEIVWLASIPLLGKQGFLALKKKAFGFLKLDEGPISRGRHRLGVTLLVASVGIHILLSAALIIGHANVERAQDLAKPWLGLNFQEQAGLWIGLEGVAMAGLIIAIFVLGADFWERFQTLFTWRGGEPVATQENKMSGR